MEGTSTEVRWVALLAPRLALTLVVLLSGNMLHSMNVLITATLLPSVVADIGGAQLMSWPTTAFVAASIVAAAGTGIVGGALGNARAFCCGASIYGGGAVLCGLAPSIGWLIAGRFVQGVGGGLISALAYVLVRSVFPEPLWPRVLGVLSGVWSVTVLAGPLIGGVFANHGYWRGAFFTVAAIGFLLAAGALAVLPADRDEGRETGRTFPALRVGLICGAIGLLSLAGISTSSAVRGGFIAAAFAAFALTLRIDRAAAAPMLPSDAFSLRSATGAGLWMVLILAAAYSPLAIYAPLFLQRLHGLSPLGAGYMVAAASFFWTAAALAVAPLAKERTDRLIVAGPLVMSAGLLGVGLLMGPGPVAALPLPIGLVGVGIGCCWAFVAQHVMGGAKAGEENIAAASLATVQQAGIAFGAALAGLVANASGIGGGLGSAALGRAAFWVPLAFVAAPLAASAIGLRLTALAAYARCGAVTRGWRRRTVSRQRM